MSFAQLGNGGETVDEALNLRAGALPSGGVVLITDELAASGGFLIAQFLRRALASADDASTTPSNPSPTLTAASAAAATPSPSSSATSADTTSLTSRVCLVAAEQNVAHYAQALRKLGRNIYSDMAAGRLVIVDTLTQPFGWCLEEGEESGGGGEEAVAGGVHRYTHSGRGTATRDLFDVIARALGGESGGSSWSGSGSRGGGGFVGVEGFSSFESGSGGGSEWSGATARRVVVFDSLSAVAEAETATETETETEVCHTSRRQSALAGGGEFGSQSGESSKHGGGSGGGGGPKTADGRVAALLRCCAALPSCAVVALAHADASAPAADAAGGWLAAAERRADVTLTAEDVHGHVHVNHRTGRMMPDPRQLTDTAVVAAAAAANGVRGLSLGGASVASSSGADAPGWGATEEEEFDEPEAPPRAVSARFQLTELGPRVTRIHRPSGSGAAS